MYHFLPNPITRFQISALMMIFHTCMACVVSGQGQFVGFMGLGFKPHFTIPNNSGLGIKGLANNVPKLSQ